MAKHNLKRGDKVKLHSDVLKRHARSVPAHAGYSKEEFAWRKTLDSLKGKVGEIERTFSGSHVNVQFGKQVIGIDASELVKESKLNEKTLSVPEKHQKKIALKTLKMPSAMVGVMGGMTKDEAKKFLKSIGYNDRQIKKLEESIKPNYKNVDSRLKSTAIKMVKQAIKNGDAVVWVDDDGEIKYTDKSDKWFEYKLDKKYNNIKGIVYKSVGFNESVIDKKENIQESDLRQLIRAMVEQEMDKIDVGDEEDKFDVDEKCDKKNEEEELEEVSTTGDVAGYQTPYAFAKRLRDRTREISQQLGYKLVNDPEDRDWKDIEDAQKESLVYRKKFAEMKVRSGLSESTLTDLKKLLKKDGWKDVKVKKPERNIEYVANMEKGKKFVTIYKEKGEEDKWMMVQYGSEYGDAVDSLDQETLRNIKRELIGENINETNIGKKGSIKSIGTWIKILKAATKGQYTFDKDDMRDLIDSLKNISQSIEALNEGRRGAYQNYRDDSDKTPRQKIGEAIRSVRDQLQEIEKTIDLNLRLKQETGIDSQKYWKNTHRALSKINEKMTRIINKVRRF